MWCSSLPHVNRAAMLRRKELCIQRLILWLPTIESQFTVSTCCHIIGLSCRCIFPTCIGELQQQLIPSCTAYDTSHTCLTLHTQPFLSSCGHLSANVAVRASIMVVFNGYSWRSPESCAPIDATIAHPHSGACLRCSTSGSSSSSQPSSDFLHRKHATLSGLTGDG